jgi:hypothetical protein
MRTQNVLAVAAAALAAGVVTSQAQVYSQNIVGYVNNAVGNNYSVQSVPFDAANGNALTNLVVNSGQLDGAYVYVWGGHSFSIYTLDSTMATGVADSGDSVAVPAPVLNPGTAFIINNGTGTPTTNTYVGTVHIGSGSYPGTSTNFIAANALYSFIAPVIPVGGGISSVCGLTNNGSLDGDYVYVPNIVNGLFKGYTISTFDSSMATGFGDSGDNVQAPEPQIPVGGGFFFNNANGTPVTWIQSIGQ